MTLRIRSIVAWLALMASPLAAQSARDTAHTVLQKSALSVQKTALDSIVKSVLPATNQYCASHNAAGYMKTACPILSRQTQILLVQRTALSAAESLLIYTVPPIIPPVDTSHPPPADTTFHVFAQSNFNSGSLAPFWNPYAAVQPGNTNIIPNPTGASGNVLQFHYENWPSGGNYDANIAIETDQNDPATHATNGDEVIFEGDFYLPRGPLTDTLNLSGLRKLNYWCSAAGPSHACLVLATQPNWPSGYPLPPGMAVPDQQLMLSLSIPNLPCDCPYYGFNILSNHWYHLLVDMKLNTTNARQDGKLRIVVDGAVVTDRSDVQYVDPLSTAPIDWYDWRIGEQINSGHKIAEDRYWNHLVFRMRRAPPSALAARRIQADKRVPVPRLKFPAHEQVGPPRILGRRKK